MSSSTSLFHFPSKTLTWIGDDQTTEKAGGEVGIDVRMCKECKKTVFSRQDFAASLAYKPPHVKAYENLVQFETGIRLMLPKFQRLLQALQYGDFVIEQNITDLSQGP